MSGVRKEEYGESGQGLQLAQIGLRTLFIWEAIDFGIPVFAKKSSL